MQYITDEMIHAMHDEMVKISSPAIGAGIGGWAAGPLGAGVGAYLGKDKRKKYHGSPVARSILGNVGGGVVGAMLGGAMGAPMHMGSPAARQMGLALMGLGAVAGSIAGGAYGASTVKSDWRHPRKKRR